VRARVRVIVSQTHAHGNMMHIHVGEK